MKVIVKLKTKSELEKIGYMYNPKSLFVPMRIDLAKDEVRLKDAESRTIPMAIFQLLGKEVEIDPSSGAQIGGVETLRFYPKNSGGRGYNLPATIAKVTPRLIAQLVKQEKRKQKDQNKFTSTGFKIGGYAGKFYPHRSEFEFGCRSISAKEMRRLVVWVNKQLQTKKK